MSSHSWMVGVALPLGALLLVSAWNSGSQAAVAADETAVKDAVWRGEHLMIKGGATLDYAPSWLGGPMPPALKAAAGAKLARDFDGAFAPALSKRFQAEIGAFHGRAEARDPNSSEPGTLAASRVAGPPPKPPEYPLIRVDGGLEKISFDETTVTGDTAKVRATVNAWAEVAQVREGVPYTAYPHNVVIVELTLQRQAGRWLITDRQWDFAPGAGP